jgi:RNA polymerase sigma-70 factor (ECF subfamily)
VASITDVKVAYPRAFSGILPQNARGLASLTLMWAASAQRPLPPLELLAASAGTLQNHAYPMTQMALSDVNLDLDLLRRLRAGDAHAMSALYQRHQGPLYRFALLRCGSSELAADVVQDVFVALIENKLAFDPARGSLANFLFGVARNFVLKREEAQRRHLPMPSSTDEDGETIDIDLLDPAPLPVESLLASERAEAVRTALAQLAPHYRDVLSLYEMQDQSYVEIAHICNIDIGTVRSRLSRARAKLLELLSSAAAIQPSGSDMAGLGKNTAESRSTSRSASQ